MMPPAAVEPEPAEAPVLAALTARWVALTLTAKALRTVGRQGIETVVARLRAQR